MADSFNDYFEENTQWVDGQFVGSRRRAAETAEIPS